MAYRKTYASKESKQSSFCSLLPLIVMLLMLPHCTSWGKFWDIPFIGFDQRAYWFYQGNPIKPVTPNLKGDIRNCEATPALPQGLSIDPASCTISGTPAQAQGALGYTVSGSTSAGPASVNISIRIASSVPTRVYGQADFTSNGVGVSATAMSNPNGCVSNSSGFYVVDRNNSRVLYFEPNSTTASRVYGQGGSFTANVANNGGRSASSLSYPDGMCADTNGIYVVDTGNNPVPYFAGTSTTASRVYGQLGNFTTATLNIDGVSANGLSNPEACASDGNGVYIADYDNSRVLYFAGTSTTASRVYGQYGSFTTNIDTNGGISADSLSGILGLFWDGAGLYISDGNHRVLYYSDTSTTATRVYGQPDFISATANNGGISANSLRTPSAIYVDREGLYVADTDNHRALFYPGTSTTATRVYGQPNFTTATSGLSATNMNQPFGICGDDTGLYIVDTANNRVMYY